MTYYHHVKLLFEIIVNPGSVARSHIGSLRFCKMLKHLHLYMSHEPFTFLQYFTYQAHITCLRPVL